MADERWAFAPVGMGYVVRNEPCQTEIHVTHVRRSRGDLHGQVTVRCNFAGVKTVDGVLHTANFNLSASGSRASLAKLLEARTPGLGFDWFDGLETLCQKTLSAETVGQPIIEVGTFEVERSALSYIVEPVIPAGVTTLLYGPGGSGKSVISLGIALSVATGLEVVPGLKPRDVGPVLYLDWETDGYVVNERIRSIATGSSFEPVNILYRRCNRPLADDADELSHICATRGVKFILIDSAGMAMGAGGDYGDANESTIRLFDAIRHIGLSTLVVDHVSKQEMKTADGKTKAALPYGSVYKVNLSRSAWELRNTTAEGDERLSLSLVHAKANDSRLREPIGLSVDWQPGAIAFGTEIVREAPALPTLKTQSDMERIVALLHEEPLTPSAIATSLALTGGTEMARSLLSRAKARGLVEELGSHGREKVWASVRRGG